MRVRVFGVGCAACRELAANAQTALDELAVRAAVEKVQDIDAIVAGGVLTTPALMLDDSLVLAGRSANVAEVRRMIERHIAGGGRDKTA